MTRNARIRFQPHDCVVCGKVHDPVILDAEKFRRWKVDGKCIQDVFPEMSKEQREILISGTCPECWDELFKRCKEEELELENTDKNEVASTIKEAEKAERDKMDRMNAALDIIRVREENKWEQRNLEQHAKDLEKMEHEEEELRQIKLEEWYESVDEWNSFWTTDPLMDNPFF